MITRRTALGLLAASPLAATPLSKAFAADYPSRPVKFVVGYPPGGATDILARLIGQKLSERLGQQFIVENKPGAGNNIGTESVVNAEPDGYTVLLVNPANYINATLYANLKFNFVRDIAPVAAFQRVPNVMTVNKDVPAKTVAEFIDYVKANPGKVNMASSGNGTSVHMAAELFKAMTKCDMLHVPYRGSALAFPDIISNKVQLIFDNLPTALEQARGGSVRALGVTSPQRWPTVPDVPAIAETVPGYESVGFYGISAPKGTPPEIVEILNKAVGEALKDPKLVARLTETGGIPRAMTPAEFGKLVAEETEKWRKVVEFAGVSVD